MRRWSSSCALASIITACAAAPQSVPTPSVGTPAPAPSVSALAASGAPPTTAGASAPSPAAGADAALPTGYPVADAGVVFLILGGRLIHYDGRTGEVRQVGMGAQFATSSRTGAYLVPFGGRASLIEWDGATRALDCGELLRRVSISASGDCAGVRGDLSLTIRQDAGAPRVVIPPGGGALDVAWSPDGRELALIRRMSQFENALWVIRPDGSGSELYRAPRGSNGDTLYWPAWSPDGSRIAVVLNRFGSFSLGADAGVSLLLVSHPAGRVRDLGIVPLTPDRIRWSAMGALAFARGPGREPAKKREVVVHRPDGAETVVGTPLSDRPAWNADGRRLAFSEADGTATRISIADLTGTARTSLWCPRGDASAARWSMDGTRLLLLCHERGSDQREIWLRSIDGGAARLLTVRGQGLIDLFDHLSWSEASP